ncbi:hypothetical protein BDR05DRAFT_1002265 [Suillus weaverae]|nr:hypothetical protein BDR05DRAFT_1002265 [Suillus weaverae]
MHNPLWLDITTTPYMVEPEEFVTVYEGSIKFDEVVYAMADECFVYSHQGILYNIPAKRDLEPPFYCVTSGRYISVFPSYLWDGVKTELQTPGHRAPTYFAVQSLFLGEHEVRCAIWRMLAANSDTLSGLIMGEHIRLEDN